LTAVNGRVHAASTGLLLPSLAKVAQSSTHAGTGLPQCQHAIEVQCAGMSSGKRALHTAAIAQPGWPWAARVRHCHTAVVYIRLPNYCCPVKLAHGCDAGLLLTAAEGYCQAWPGCHAVKVNVHNGKEAGYRAVQPQVASTTHGQRSASMLEQARLWAGMVQTVTASPSALFLSEPPRCQTSALCCGCVERDPINASRPSEDSCRPDFARCCGFWRHRQGRARPLMAPC
jgi:hypothetical protein